MPLTKKGKKVLKKMRKTYGSSKKAKKVFYASINSGKLDGTHLATGDPMKTCKKKKKKDKAMDIAQFAAKRGAMLSMTSEGDMHLAKSLANGQKTSESCPMPAMTAGPNAQSKKKPKAHKPKELRYSKSVTDLAKQRAAGVSCCMRTPPGVKTGSTGNPQPTHMSTTMEGILGMTNNLTQMNGGDPAAKPAENNAINGKRKSKSRKGKQLADTKQLTHLAKKRAEGMSCCMRTPAGTKTGHTR